jgi:hypothetical protein
MPVILRPYHLWVTSLSLGLMMSCKTPNRSPSRSDLEAVDRDIVKLRDFSYEMSDGLLRNLAGRVGCQTAAQMVHYPAGGPTKKIIDEIYKSPSPYDTIMGQFFNHASAEKLCKSEPVARRQDPAHAMERLISALKAKNHGLTFVMVGGFGSHLTDEGALYESRRLWQARFGADSKYFRVVRHECQPNSFATDEVCSPLLVKKFNELEATRGDVQHRYLFWGYSKGGTSLLRAFSLAPEMREKALALVTVGSPIGGGLPISTAKPILEQIAQRKAVMSPADRVTVNTLLTFGAGSAIDTQNSGMTSKFASLFEDQEFKNLQAGFESLGLETRKKYIYDQIKTWNFGRKNPDPITKSRNLPIFHLAAAVDVARLDPIPYLTVNQNGDIITEPKSQNIMHLAEMALLTKFRNHPLSDTCVALEHAVIPQNAQPAGTSVKLLAVLNLDHMSLGLSKALKHGKNTVPHLEIVDSIIESVMQSLNIGDL